MSLEGGKLRYETDYGRKYSKNILSNCKNNLIYSNEPYEFAIDGGTPSGKIIVPSKIIHLPCKVKRVVVEDKSVNINESKVINIDEIEKGNNKFIEATISNIVSFNLRIYDKDDNVYKIICYSDKYPTPDKGVVIKEFIEAYSIVITKVLIKCNRGIVYNNYEKFINLRSKATVKDIRYRLCRVGKEMGCDENKHEYYQDLLVEIEIDNQLETFL